MQGAIVREINFGGEKFPVSRMRLRGMFQLNDWIRRQPRPARIPFDLKGHLATAIQASAVDLAALDPQDRAKFAAETRKECIRSAESMAREEQYEASQWPPTLAVRTGAAIDVIMGSEEGLAELIFVCLSANSPGITRERVNQLIDLASPQELDGVIAAFLGDESGAPGADQDPKADSTAPTTGGPSTTTS